MHIKWFLNKIGNIIKTQPNFQKINSMKSLEELGTLQQGDILGLLQVTNQNVLYCFGQIKQDSQYTNLVELHFIIEYIQIVCKNAFSLCLKFVMSLKNTKQIMQYKNVQFQIDKQYLFIYLFIYLPIHLMYQVFWFALQLTLSIIVKFYYKFSFFKQLFGSFIIKQLLYAFLILNAVIYQFNILQYQDLHKFNKINFLRTF
ncbi:transmembrane protein, putative (macronuclear) [Tetrahymena thermophila SB210]|uniref:Transmembrane protein, putative n=1 Tax=Tetrahymena thermophila (strain SB210) TaxID=312017 RepID=W7XFB9_TETTS|nr:transmembrane protein, putative [Tetrahymena thermophila SB210]EWS72696.1 transmembrane protein, putative [Tetrahymena thermophila SB210]|eukprot:XP_012654772.1 transmembrane protein, putative [Tetrahymena thermophila SB210]